MLHKLDLGSERVVGFSWEGKFDEKALKQSLVQFLPELQSRAHMNVYVEVHEISEVEAKAVWEDFKFGVKNVKEIMDKVDKIAVVTDITWLRNFEEGAAKLIPGIKLKAFTFNEKEAAKLWVME